MGSAFTLDGICPHSWRDLPPLLTSSALTHQGLCPHSSRALFSLIKGSAIILDRLRPQFCCRSLSFIRDLAFTLHGLFSHSWRALESLLMDFVLTLHGSRLHFAGVGFYYTRYQLSLSFAPALTFLSSNSTPDTPSPFCGLVALLSLTGFAFISSLIGCHNMNIYCDSLYGF